MISTLILVALSAVSGFVIGRNHFPYHAMLAAAVVLAPLSAVILQNQGFGAISGIFTIVSCLTLNQVAYFVGAIRENPGPEDRPHQQADDVPRDGRNDDVRREQKREQNSPIQTGPTHGSAVGSLRMRP
jgi:hypothetical protein